MITRSGRSVFFLLALFPLAACASSPSSAKTPEPAPSSAMATSVEAADDRPAPPTAPVVGSATAIDSAGDDLGRAEQELDGLIGKDGAKRKDSELAAGGAEGQPEDGSACDRACRAYSSMQRAASHLCELAGDDEPRCASAKERLTRARTRVQSSCPLCEATQH